MKTSRQGSQTIRPEWIRWLVWYGPDVRVEVVDATRADVGNVLQAHGAHNGLAASLEGKLLLAKLHIHLVS